jgi:4-hydroxybenzoate polyprenyltransferase
VMILLIVMLWQSYSKLQYIKIHNILKFLIVTGVFSIVLIDPTVLWNGRKVLLAVGA